MDWIPYYFQNLNPIIQGLIATLFTWGMTALGAATVFFTTHVSRRFLDASLGFAAGVMIAASFWSLLAPSITLSIEMGLVPWLAPLAGFLLGGAFLRLVDRILPHLHLFASDLETEGISTRWRRGVLLVLAITLHNIPEGVAVGVAFGAASVGLAAEGLGAAVALAIGIGLQNLPEGTAVSVPLRGEGMSRLKSFWYGQLSAVVEPIAAVLGAAAHLDATPTTLRPRLRCRCNDIRRGGGSRAGITARRKR